MFVTYTCIEVENMVDHSRILKRMTVLDKHLDKDEGPSHEELSLLNIDVALYVNYKRRLYIHKELPSFIYIF